MATYAPDPWRGQRRPTLPPPTGGGPRIIQVGGADAPLPGGGLTLDALLARQKALANQDAPQMAGMGSALGPVAYGAQSLLQGLQAGFAERDARQAQAALGGALAHIDPNTGELPPEYRGTVATLDPDAYLKMTQDMIAARRRQQELQQGHQWDVDAATLAAQRQADAAALAVKTGRETSDINRRAEDKIGDENAQRDAAIAQDKADYDARIAEEKARQDAARASTAADEASTRSVGEAGAKTAQGYEQRAAEAARLGLKPGTREYQTFVGTGTMPAPVETWEDIVVPGQPVTQQRNTVTNEIRSVTRNTTGADRKALWDQQDQYVNTASSASALRRAQELLTQGINTGYTSDIVTAAGKLGLGDADTANRTDEYNRIMNPEAIQAMSVTLKGATTDTELQEFIKNMNDATIDPAVKRMQINRMMAKVEAYQRLQQQRILDLGGDLPRVDEPATTGGLPPGVTEDDIQFTMKQRGMTRDQVLAELKKRSSNGP